MRANLFRIFVWLFRKIFFAGSVAAFVIVVLAVRLFLYDPVDFASDREAKLKQAEAHGLIVADDLKGKNQELAELRARIRGEQERADRAGAVVVALAQLKSRWALWFGDAEQQKLNEQNAARLREIQAAANQKLLLYQQAATRRDWEAHNLRRESEKIAAQIHLLDQSHSPYRHYGLQAWEKAKWYLLIVLLFYFFGIPICRVVLYFFIAPWLVRGKPLQFSSFSPKFPLVLKSAATLDVALWPGDIFRARRKMLVATEQSLGHGKRILFDWRFPFTSWFSGLCGLREVRHNVATGEQIVTLAVPDEGDTEFSLVQVPEGAGIIVRPRFLAAVVQPGGQKLRWKSRWRLSYLNAWAAAQWRFLEISGPCRVILFGPPPSRVEVLQPRAGEPQPARRFRGRAIVGFSPDVEYRRIRTENFWRYAMGRQKLLDAHFVGPGVLICHEAQRRPGGSFRRAWGGMLHAFGL